MSSNRKLIKGCCPTSKVTYYPAFKAMKCLPVAQGEPGTYILPVYGSLYMNQTNTATPNTILNFNSVGPSNGVILDTTDNSITVSSSGVYTIAFSTEILALGDEGAIGNIIFHLSINGTPDITKEIGFQTQLGFGAEVTTLSRTDQLTLNQGDMIRVFTSNATTNIFAYFNAALVVTKVS